MRFKHKLTANFIARSLLFLWCGFITPALINMSCLAKDSIYVPYKIFFSLNMYTWEEKKSWNDLTHLRS
jgi:hypothetical protein